MTEVVFSTLQVVWTDSTKPDTFIPLFDKSGVEDGSILKKPQNVKEVVPLKKCLLISKPIFENKLWLNMNQGNNVLVIKHVNNLLTTTHSTIHAIRSLIRLDYHACNMSSQQNNDSAILSSWM